MFCGQKKSTKEKKEQWFIAKDIFAKIPERQTKWDSCSFHGFPFQVCAGAWGEEETKDERRNKEEETRHQERDARKKRTKGLKKNTGDSEKET